MRLNAEIGGAVAHAGALADIENLPTLPYYRTSVATDTYTPGTFQRTGTIHFDLNAANATLQASVLNLAPAGSSFRYPRPL